MLLLSLTKPFNIYIYGYKVFNILNISIIINKSKKYSEKKILDKFIFSAHWNPKIYMGNRIIKNSFYVYFSSCTNSILLNFWGRRLNLIKFNTGLKRNM